MEGKGREGKARKRFFFVKKKQKTFMSWGTGVFDGLGQD